MSTSVASLPNWRWEFDSPRPLQASPQVSTGEAGSQPTEQGPQVSPTVSPNSSEGGTCAHFSCELPATDRRRGMPLCRGHFFLALQWEQAS